MVLKKKFDREEKFMCNEEQNFYIFLFLKNSYSVVPKAYIIKQSLESYVESQLHL